MSVAEEAGVKIPEGRVYQLPTDPDQLWDGLKDVGLGIRWVAEVKKADMQIELSGPKWEYKSYTIMEVVEEPGIVQSGQVTLIGPDIHEVEPHTDPTFRGAPNRRRGVILARGRRRDLDRGWADARPRGAATPRLEMAGDSPAERGGGDGQVAVRPTRFTTDCGRVFTPRGWCSSPAADSPVILGSTTWHTRCIIGPMLDRSTGAAA